MKREHTEDQNNIADEPFDATDAQGTDGRCDSANMSDETSGGGDNSANVAEENDWKDKYMRLSAEFDNYRKRTLKEKMDLIVSGGEDVIRVILPVVDDMERAIKAMEDAGTETIMEGVVLIYNKLLEALRGKGVAEIEALGRELDTDEHEAVAKIPSEESKGRIVDVIQKGYKLKDKVIRYAKVVVGE